MKIEMLKKQYKNKIYLSLFIFLFFFFLICFQVKAQPILLSDISYDPIQKTVSLYCTKIISPQIKRFNNPERIVIDIPDTFWINGQKILNIEDVGIKQIRISQYQAEPPQARVVFELFGTDSQVDLDMKIEAEGKKGFIFKMLIKNPKEISKPSISPTNEFSKKGFLKTIEFKDNALVISASEPIKPEIRRVNSLMTCVILLPDIFIHSQGIVPVNSTWIKSLKLENNSSGGIINIKMDQSLSLVPEFSDDNKILILKSIKTIEFVNLIAIKDIIIDEVDKYNTKVQIITEQPFTFKIDRLFSPPRFVIDTVGTILKDATPSQQLNGSIVTAIRFGAIEWLPNSSNHGVRIVLDLTSPVGYEYKFKNDSTSLEIMLSTKNSTAKFSENNYIENNNNMLPPPLLPYIPNINGPIVLDAGHGGRDPGCVGVNKCYEKDVNLAVIFYLKQFLENKGKKVILSRSDDSEVLLQPRVDVANQNQASIFVSIHSNSIPNPDITGIETYYYTDQSLLFAQTLHKHLITKLNVPDRKVRQRQLFVTRKTFMPSVLIEIGFLTNSTEAALLASPKYQEKIASALFDGIIEYFTLVSK